MNSALRMLSAVAVYALAPDAHAAAVTIDFDGLDGGRNTFIEAPANFYNGGLGSLGSGPGPDYGITFARFGTSTADAQAICNVTFNCDGGAGNSLFILGGVTNNGVERGAVMHIAGGFRGIVEFDASISNDGPARVFAETSHGGNIISGTLVRHPDPTDPCGRLQCEFAHYSFNLADDIFTPDDVVAHTLLFLTRAADAVFIDNIRFHDLILPETPVAVSEPSTALVIGGAGLLGATLRRRRGRGAAGQT